MRVHGENELGRNRVIYEFLSLGDLAHWMEDAPVCDAFKGKRRASRDNGRDFTGTDSFSDAWDMFMHGWPDAAREMTGKYKKMRDYRQRGTAMSLKPDVVGFQPIVPNWLANQPLSMVNARMDVKKQKVLNMVKIITYHAGMSEKTMREDGLKTLVLVDTLEKAGYRINLEVCDMGTASGFLLGSIFRVKNANERFNIAKMAFPIAHPSMLRRIVFSFIECCPHTTKRFTSGYGSVPSNGTFMDVISKLGRNYYVIPARLGDNYTPHTLEEFKEIFNVK